MQAHTTAQETPEDLARTALQQLSVEKSGLSCYPHNRFDLVTSTWWIGERGKAPHYRKAKLFFAPARSSATKFEVGFLVEKGLGTTAKEDPRLRRQVMEENWRWLDIVPGLGGPHWCSAVEQVCARSVMMCRLKCEVGRKSEELEFVVRGSGALELVEHSRTEFLQPLKHARRLGELADALVVAKNLDWTWIDLWFWSPVGRLANDATVEAAREADSRLVRDLLEPYTQFLLP